MQQNNIYKHILYHVVLVSRKKNHERGLIFRRCIEKFNSPKEAQNIYINGTVAGLISRLTHGFKKMDRSQHWILFETKAKTHRHTSEPAKKVVSLKSLDM
jgi:hypothetical protein